MAQYQSRISGPMIDRIDLVIDVPGVTASDLMLPPAREGSADVAARVAKARHAQLERYAAQGLEHITTNAACPAAILDDIARPDAEGMRLLREAADAMRLIRARDFTAFSRWPEHSPIWMGRIACGGFTLRKALSYRSNAARSVAGGLTG